MTSRTRPSFWRAYARLSEPNRLAAQRAYAPFAQNPDHPSLRFKKARRLRQHLVYPHQRNVAPSGIAGINELDNLFG
jgi:hypothetical protein